MATSLGSISSLNVGDWDGFDYPEPGHVTPLLGDGSGAGLNALIQTAALGFKQAKIGGVITSSADLAYLRGYYSAKTTVTFTYGSDTYSVVVFDLKVTKLLVSSDVTWAYSCTLHQVA